MRFLVVLTDANGSGWWDCNMEGVDGDEVGCNQAWEGVGSTTLGGLEWHWFVLSLQFRGLVFFFSFLMFSWWSKLSLWIMWKEKKKKKPNLKVTRYMVDDNYVLVEVKECNRARFGSHLPSILLLYINWTFCHNVSFGLIFNNV